MSIVYLDSTSPDGTIKVYNTETRESVQVPADSESLKAAAKELKEEKPS